MGTKLLKIDNIAIFVQDLDKASKFYEDVLGLNRVWTDSERGMRGVVFPGSDSEVVIHNDSTLPSPDFSFLVESVENSCDEFRTQGYEVLFGPVEVRCGKLATLSDPDGNKIPIIDLTKFGGKARHDS